MRRQNSIGNGALTGLFPGNGGGVRQFAMNKIDAAVVQFHGTHPLYSFSRSGVSAMDTASNSGISIRILVSLVNESNPSPRLAGDVHFSFSRPLLGGFLEMFFFQGIQPHTRLL